MLSDVVCVTSAFSEISFIRSLFTLTLVCGLHLIECGVRLYIYFLIHFILLFLAPESVLSLFKGGEAGSPVHS